MQPLNVMRAEEVRGTEIEVAELILRHQDRSESLLELFSLYYSIACDILSEHSQASLSPRPVPSRQPARPEAMPGGIITTTIVTVCVVCAYGAYERVHEARKARNAYVVNFGFRAFSEADNKRRRVPRHPQQKGEHRNRWRRQMGLPEQLYPLRPW